MHTLTDITTGLEQWNNYGDLNAAATLATTVTPTLLDVVNDLLALHAPEQGTFHKWVGPNDAAVMRDAGRNPDFDDGNWEAVTYIRCRDCYRRGDCSHTYPCTTVTTINNHIDTGVNCVPAS